MMRLFIYESAQTIYNQAKAKYDQRVSSSDNPIALESEVLNEALTENLGKEHPGRVRGKGLGVTKKKIIALQLATSMNNQTSEFSAMKLQIAKLKK